MFVVVLVGVDALAIAKLECHCKCLKRYGSGSFEWRARSTVGLYNFVVDHALK